MQVLVEPAHAILNGDVQVPEVVVRGNFDPPPDRGLDVAQGDLQLQNLFIAMMASKVEAL